MSDFTPNDSPFVVTTLSETYTQVVKEHCVPNQSINDPAPGGITRDAAVAEALARIGRPARDRVDIKMASALIELRERDYEDGRKKTLVDVVISSFFPVAGAVPTAEDWLAEQADERSDDLDEVVALVKGTDQQDAMLREAIEFAMPAILAKITADDQRRRGVTSDDTTWPDLPAGASEDFRAGAIWASVGAIRDDLKHIGGELDRAIDDVRTIRDGE